MPAMTDAEFIDEMGNLALTPAPDDDDFVCETQDFRRLVDIARRGPGVR